MRRLYNDRRWRKARLQFLADNPLCVMCRDDGRTVAASVVDHIKPHRGDVDLFWDEQNWQPLCTQHHDSTKARMERGKSVGCDEAGVPIDPQHGWRVSDGEGGVEVGRRGAYTDAVRTKT